MGNDFIQVKAGTPVRSCAGRDKDRIYVAVSVHDGRVFVADGKKHRLCSPKAKNPRHISPVGDAVDLGGLGDRKLRRLINTFKTQNVKGAENEHRPLKTGEING